MRKQATWVTNVVFVVVLVMVVLVAVIVHVVAMVWRVVRVPEIALLSSTALWQGVRCSHPCRRQEMP